MAIVIETPGLKSRDGGVCEGNQKVFMETANINNFCVVVCKICEMKYFFICF